MIPAVFAPADLPPTVTQLCATFRKHGFRAWLVGGSVRNILLGTPVQDWDFATDAEPQDVQRIFKRTIATGIAHGTVTVLINGDPFEVTTLRGESTYTDGRRPDSIVFLTDIEDDLARRDFTINAIAVEPTSGAIIDPFHGQLDLESRLIRAVGNPDDRFSEDGLRPMRAARFASVLDFDVEAETALAMGRHLDTFARVAKERIFVELDKLLKSKKPSRGLRLLIQTGMWSATWPEGSEKNETSRDWEATLALLDQASDASVRWAICLGPDPLSARQFMVHVKFPAQLRERIIKLLEVPRLPRNESAPELRRHVLRIGRDLLEEHVSYENLVHGDVRPATLEALGSANATAIDTGQLAVSGTLLMRALALPPGPIVGQTLRHLVEHLTVHPEQNTESRLLEIAKAFLEQKTSGGAP